MRHCLNNENYDRGVTVDFLAEHQLYIVLAIVLAIWFGLYWYLFRLEGRIKRLEDRLK